MTTTGEEVEKRKMKGDMELVSSSDSTSESSSDLGKENQREGWKGKLDFLLTCVGYAVGLGNIWRFPYLCYRSGGGAFFVPYVTFLFLCGMPLFFMEVSYGQFASLSPIAVWKICPLFKGVGIGMVIVSAIVCIYYNVIVAWTIYYLFVSFQAVLPWSECGNSWNTEYCVDGSHLANTTMTNYTGYEMNNSSVIFSLINHTTTELPSNLSQGLYNFTEAASNISIHKVTASEEYWHRHVLEITDGIENLGTIRWQLLLCLIAAWIFVFLCLFKGVDILGKVMHFAAPFPYLVLLVLLVRGVTLPGAIDGIKFYLVPRWEKLAEFKVWGDAALQIFYSVGMAWGGIITMASYNRFNHNIYRDAMIVPIINCSTSIFAGCVIFSVLGFMAHEAGSTVAEVVTEGPGLTFVAYPEAVAKLPISPLWSVLFFLMLFTIGLDSQFGMFETCLSAFMDEYPQYLRDKRVLVSAVVCVFEFLVGIPLVTQGGIYILQIMDWYCACFSLMLISLAECIVIAWIYGCDRFYEDIELMIGYKPCFWWKICWKYITPATILFVWVFSVTQLAPVTYGDVVYPDWAIVFGWVLGFVSLIPIPVVMVIQIMNEEGSLLERVKKLVKPAADWGPSTPEDRELYLQSRCSKSSSKSSKYFCKNTLTKHTYRMVKEKYPTTINAFSSLQTAVLNSE
ncbi:hypothetical protein ScPMuIL_011057 [Solemya velum]